MRKIFKWFTKDLSTKKIISIIGKLAILISVVGVLIWVAIVFVYFNKH